MASMHEITCKNCGGAISLDDEWDRTPESFRPSDWRAQYCIMCGGEMTVYRRWIDPPKAHSQCLDARFHLEPCSMCFGPMAITSGLETARSFHSRCVPENWYERACQICQKPLKIHVEWDDVPVVHRACESQQWYEKECKYCNATLKVHVDWENTPDAHDECGPTPATDVFASEPPSSMPELAKETVVRTFVEPPIAIARAIQTEGETTNAAEPGPEILIERNGSVERDVELADTPWESFNDEMSELAGRAEQPPEKPTAHEHEYACSECGEHVARLDGTLQSVGTLCRKCRHDALLVSGAVAALRKRFPGDLNVIVETKTRTITEKIAVVSKVENDEVVAEVKLCDDGVFSSERAAVAYDPKTEQRFSKTVFGQKGLFSSLRTTETFDSDGTLIQATRPGKELPLAAGDDRDEPHAVEITNNRFFLKQK